jgi:hypothetical protein
MVEIVRAIFGKLADECNLKSEKDANGVFFVAMRAGSDPHWLAYCTFGSG